MSMSVAHHFVEEIQVSADKYWIEIETKDKEGNRSEMTMFIGNQRSDEEREEMARSVLKEMHRQIGILLQK